MPSSSSQCMYAFSVAILGMGLAICLSAFAGNSSITWMFGKVGTLIFSKVEQQNNNRRVIVFRNLASLPADLHLDDGLLGYRLGVLEVNGKPLHVNVRVGDRFFFTTPASAERFVDSGGSLVEVVVEPETFELTLPQESEAQGRRCLDRYKLCSNQSASELCYKQPGWMISNCCATCDAVLNSSQLLDPDIRCNREFLNTTHSRAWDAGDVDSMFSRILHSATLHGYTARVLASPPDKPWVVSLDNFLSNDESSALIQGAISEGFQKSGVQKEKHNSVNSVGELATITDSSRTSSTAWCSKAKCGARPLVRQVVEKVQNITGVSHTHFEPLQILSYTEGQYCKPHLDSKRWLEGTAAGHRIFTVLLFLRLPELGGETAFDRLDLKVAPNVGSALIWSNVLNENPDELDKRVFHEGLAVQRGNKVVANAWGHMYDVDLAEKWGC